ncbi:MAG: hypothetical protein FWE63_08675 [Bacteroidales bacterium]|nr:hypothetical protein [Bacteroidales bacterium]
MSSIWLVNRNHVEVERCTAGLCDHSALLGCGTHNAAPDQSLQTHHHFER